MTTERCDISVKPHPVLGEIFEVRGDCRDRIKAINEKQGPYHRKMFNRRLVHIDDKSNTSLPSKTSTE